MFQFTRELIINSLDGKLKNVASGDVTIDVDTYQDASDVKGKLGVATYGAGARAGVAELLIDNFINIDGSCVRAASYHLPEDAVKEVVELDLGTKLAALATDSKIAEGDVVRLVVVLGQEGRVISTYNDQYPDHSNRLFVEAKYTVNAATTLAALIANAAAADKRLENCLVKVEAGSVNNNVKISALDEFTRVKSVKFVKVGTDKVPSGALLTGYGDYVEIVCKDRKDFSASELTAGKVGCGTTNVLIRNNRLLTAAHLDPFGTHGDERPIPGGKYTQFNIEVVTKRNQIGHQVFGSVGDESLCTVILFALGDADNDTDSAAAFVKAAIGDTLTGASSAVTCDKFPA